MPRELLYTSAPRGLLAGRSGYCTVAATAGLSSSMIEQLERLSGYLAFPETQTSSEQAEAFSHWRMPVLGKLQSVLSKVKAVGIDYTGRSRKEIYHVVLDSSEHPMAGPAWLLLQPNMMDGPDGNRNIPSPTNPHWIRGLKALPPVSSETKSCVSWERVTGDAGWAGVFAARLMSPATNVSYLICPSDVAPLSLIEEAMLLLPPALRWKISFNTCFSTLPGDLSCVCRCVTPETSSRMGSTIQRPDRFVLDLTDIPRRAPNTPASEAARDGRLIAPSIMPTSCGGTINQISNG